MNLDGGGDFPRSNPQSRVRIAELEKLGLSSPDYQSPLLNQTFPHLASLVNTLVHDGGDNAPNFRNP
jgi:hypothetical protein